MNKEYGYVDSAFMHDGHRGRSDNRSISATQFNREPYQIRLEKENGTIGESPEDLVQRVVGTAVHEYIEKYGKGIYTIKEMYMEKEFDIDIDNIYTITGTADIVEYNTETNKWVVKDIKTMGAFSLDKFNKGERDAQIRQLSIYRWMLKDKLPMADYGEIIAIGLGDRVKKRLSYTQIELLSDNEVERMMLDFIEKIDTATECKDTWSGRLCANYCNVICKENGRCNTF
jgi:hypothetical protein